MAIQGLGPTAGKGFFWGGAGTGNTRRTHQRAIAGSGPALVSIDATDLRDKAQRFRSTKTGRFASADELLARVAAQRLADMMVEQREAGSVATRRPVSTGRLDKAIRSPQNRTVQSVNGVLTFGVGVPSFLNTPSSGAQYWRAIEEGTSYFVGRRLTGVFGLTVDEFGTGGAPFTPLGADRSGAFRAMSARSARSVLAGGYGRADSRKVSGIIKKPIRAQHYMRKAWEKFDARAVGRDLARNVLSEAILAGAGLKRV